MLKYKGQNNDVSYDDKLNKLIINFDFISDENKNKTKIY